MCAYSRVDPLEWVLTFLELFQNAFLEVVACATSKEQPLRQCAFIERPEDIHVVREAVQSEDAVELGGEVFVSLTLLSASHGLVHVLRDHLCGFVVACLEAGLECVDEAIREFTIRLDGRLGDGSCGSRRRGRLRLGGCRARRRRDYVDKGGGDELVGEGLKF